MTRGQLANIAKQLAVVEQEQPSSRKANILKKKLTDLKESIEKSEETAEKIREQSDHPCEEQINETS